MTEKRDTITAQCECSCSMLEMERNNEDGSIDLSMWLHGYGSGRLSWRERLRWCLNILRTGRPWTDYMILPPEEVNKLRDWLTMSRNQEERHE